jgi:hypothetical protein
VSTPVFWDAGFYSLRRNSEIRHSERSEESLFSLVSRAHPFPGFLWLRRSNLLDVISLSTQSVSCVPGNWASCERKPWCGVHPLWLRVQATLRDVLASVSIGQPSRDTEVSWSKQLQLVVTETAELDPGALGVVAKKGNAPQYETSADALGPVPDAPATG